MHAHAAVHKSRTWCTDTMSPRRTRRFLRTTLFILILLSSVLSSDSTMHTVSLRFLPCENQNRIIIHARLATSERSACCVCKAPTFSSTVSPLNSCSFSIVFGLSETTELSSLIASSTTSLLGLFFLSRMAVLKSFLSFLLQYHRPRGQQLALYS